MLIQGGEQNVGTASASASSLQSIQNRNAILVSQRQEECGRYLETIKVYENKPADLTQGQMDTDYLSRLTHALTSVRSVNKTDVVNLGSTFGSLSHIMDASMEGRPVSLPWHRRAQVSSHPPIPETPSQKDVEPSSVNEVTEVEKDAEDVNKRRKKELELTVKSALSAAFAKYADKMGAKNSDSGKRDS
ncbi:DNA excision repair protein ERCC-1 [Citrus sinensis]|uniref:DNA excision repair protein ERCC-1 n=1 Tax=Citrus sinensis TaxID=2711 RepID=A0ACB8KKD4_CITSI|nr:DNA excision repair protein ERCC-1 [Citrus sinensis]